jgi:cell division protein FtsB
MRFRLLRRRLTISAPRMAIRSHMPWPLRWALVAVVLGFCAAIGLWAFELGKDLAGIDNNAKQELAQLRTENGQLKEEINKAQSVLNTSGSLLTAEKATQDKLVSQIKQLESENRTLKDDLGFFEKLIPTGGNDGVAIRGLQAEALNAGTQLKWQVLVIQPTKNAPAFNGKLEITLSGLQGGAPGTGLGGKPWTQVIGGAAQTLQFTQYRRLENVIDLPPQVVVKQLSAKVIEGSSTRAVQTFKL